MPGGITGRYAADLDSLDASLGVRFRWNERASLLERAKCLEKIEWNVSRSQFQAGCGRKGFVMIKSGASRSVPLIRWLA